MRPASALLVVGIVTGLVIAAAAGYRLGQTETPRSRPVTPASPSASAEPAKVDPKTGRKVLYWHDPMAPGHRFDRPGKSPFMDMELVPVYADEVAGDGVSVSPRVAQNLGMRTATARRAAVSVPIEAVGTVAEDERSIRVVQSRVSGYVESLRVRANLDPVTAGQPVAVLFAPDWAPAQDEYLALRRVRADAALVQAARQRLALLSIPDEVVRAAESADQAQLRVTLRAPSTGVVSELSVREGAMVSPGMTLMRIVDLRRVWVLAEVPEAAAARVSPGQPVRVRPAGIPDRLIEGRVAAVLPQLSPETRTLRVRVELPNPDQSLKPGMLVTATITPASTGDAVLVPQAAVIPTGRRTVVIVKEDAGRFRPVDVETGREVGDEIEIRKGLDAGQTVVVSGQFLLDSEASFRSGLTRLNTAPEPSTTQGAPSPAQHQGEGTVEGIDRDEITIAHGPIASLRWPGMSMPFRARPGALPAGLTVGDEVTFTLTENAEGDMELVRMERTRAKGGRP